MIKGKIEETKIGIIGAGSWGTALAKQLGDKGFELNIWVYETTVKEQIEKYRENKLFLPGFKLPDTIYSTNDLRTAVENKDLILLVVPSHVMRIIAGQIKPFVHKDTILITASKGIENDTYLTMTQVLEESLDFLPKDNFVVLSGPSFAKEVAAKIPTVVVSASISRQNAQLVQAIFSSPTFRVYVNYDPIGTQIGGAMKNVLAIAAGICDGMKMGLNPRAALITRGLAEMNRLGTCMGADPLTLLGLAGVGDLLLTCTGDLSRNYTLGKQIGQGKSLEEIMNDMQMVAEGVKTTRSIYNLSKKLKVELPICSEVYRALFEKLSLEETADRLMNRSLKHELDGVIN